jgi:GNAT superfamily N-acetyltransferase
MTQHAIKIRKAKASDVTGVAKVRCSVEVRLQRRKTGYFRRHFPSFLDRTRDLFNECAGSARGCEGIWVAEHKGKIVGFIKTSRHSSSDAKISYLEVHPGYWGSNVAPDLFHKAENMFQQNRIKRGFLWATQNPRAQAFYKKMGWDFVYERTVGEQLYERDFRYIPK